MEGKSRGPVTSLADALSVLIQFARSGAPEIGVSELARRLDMPKSKVSRMLATFREAGWLDQNPRSKAYSVGLRAYAVGARYLNTNPLAREALPVLRSISDRSGFASHLTVLDGPDPLYVAGIEGRVSLDFGSRAGAYFPVHATAPGRILLAFSDAATIDRILKEPRMSELPTQRRWNTREIRRDIGQLKDIGYAVSRGDRVPGIGGIAVPVFGAEQRLIASLSVSYPLTIVEGESEPYYATILFEAARTLSQRLGAHSYPFGLTGSRSKADAALPLAAEGARS
jgi:DNA-binding IclR family transcriptional regulator